MSKITRRVFLLSTAALPLGCAMRPASSAGDVPTKPVRPAAVGQTWRYAKHDLYTGVIVDTQIDTVASVNRTVDIDSRFEKAPAPSGKAQWGMDWLAKYMGSDHPASGPLPSEVQDPWGMVLVDPHWGQVQVYERPIPIWPSSLRPGWSDHFVTRYKTPSDSDGLLWDQTMKAEAWETVTVPAGAFRALRYTSAIHFVHSDFARSNSMRYETAWFAPEVGRWVARESRGSYYLAESVDDRPINENGFRWELLAWT